MSPAHLLEPTYSTIKRYLMVGRWLPGSRLATTHLALDLDVSLSPVRDSLNRLAGERMVDFEPGAGFHVPRFGADDFSALLDLNRVLLDVALLENHVLEPFSDPVPDDHASRSAVIFRHLALHSRNPELVQAVDSINDRLHVFNRLDPIVQPEPAAEIDALLEALELAASPATVRGPLLRFHAARKQAAGRYIELRAHLGVDGSGPDLD